MRMHIAGLAGLAGLIAAPAAANVVLNNSTNGGFEVPSTSWSQTAHGGTLSRSVNLGSQGLGATSFAGFGKLTASTSAFANDFGPYSGGSGIDRRTSNANASLEDNLTIYAGAPGSTATAVFAVRISELGRIRIGDSSSVGSTGDAVGIGVYGAGSAGLNMSNFLHAVTKEFDAQHHIVTGISFDQYHGAGSITPIILPHYTASYSIQNTYLIAINFISGHPFTLVGNVFCGTSAATDALSPVVNGDCSVSEQWKGLHSVVDASGHHIAATTFSGSGFNYGSFSPGVPEPSVWATMFAGFGLAGSALRRRRGFVIAARSRSRG